MNVARRPAVLAALSAVGLVAGLVAAAPVGASAASVTTVTGTPTAAVRVSRPAAPHAATPAGPVLATRGHGARRYPGAVSAPTAALAARAAAAPVTATGGARVRPLLNIDGVSSRDSQFTNYDQTFEPPDQGLCEGAGYVLEAVNSAYRIYRTDGRSLRGPFNVNDLFNEGGQEFTSDPRCWYDAPTHTWFAIILFISSDNKEGRIDLAVDPHADPTGLWTEYQIDTTDNGQNGEPKDPGCPCFGDQPRLGIDQDNVYITTDEFSITGNQYNGGQIYAVAKSDLIAGRPIAHVVHFGHLSIGGAMAIAPQPALSTGNPDAEYFLSSLDPRGTGDDRVGVWAMTRRGAVAAGGSPLLSSVVISAERYAIPPHARQKGSSEIIDSGDDRMQQAEYVAGSVWGELTTALRPGGSGVAAGAAWFQVRPWLRGDRIGGAAMARQGYVAVPGEDVVYPAVQPDAAGRAAMVVTVTGPNDYPSAAYALLSAGSARFGPLTVAAAGTGPYREQAGPRWGDYSFAVPAVGSDAAWLATEYVPPPSSQTTTGQENWGTRVLEVPLS